MFLLIESRFLNKNFDFLKNNFLITYMRTKKRNPEGFLIITKQ